THTTQPLTAGTRTEVLLGRTRPGHEQDVTTGTVTGQAVRFFRRGCCALALARRAGLATGQLRGVGLWLLPPALSITPALLPPPSLALRRVTVAPTGVPASPPRGSHPAVHAAIPRLRPAGPKPPFAAFQQAAPAAPTPAKSAANPDWSLTPAAPRGT